MALWERLWKDLWEDAGRPLRGAFCHQFSSARGPLRGPLREPQRPQNLSEPLRAVAPIPVAPLSFSELCLFNFVLQTCHPNELLTKSLVPAHVLFSSYIIGSMCPLRICWQNLFLKVLTVCFRAFLGLRPSTTAEFGSEQVTFKGLWGYFWPFVWWVSYNSIC